MRGRALPRRGQEGATAVLVALLSLLLLTFAALAVDLGNSWARKRAVQKQVDLSALSAGYLLPDAAGVAGRERSDIAAKVATFLNANKAIGQPDVAGAVLLNGVAADGEVTFLKTDGSACADRCPRMQVLAPPARVEFGFAHAIGSSHVDIQRSATVQVESSLPPKQKLIPFWLPSGCGYGPAQLDTGQGPAAPTTSPTTSPTATSTATSTATATATATASPSPTFAFTPGPNDVGNHVLSGTSPITTAQGTTVRVSTYSITNVPNNTDRASLRFWSPSGTYSIDYATRSASQSGGTLTVPPFSVGTEVTATPGDWRVYALVENNGRAKYSSNYLTFRVTAPAVDPTASPAPTASATASATSIPVGCVGQERGNFGQLSSPRLDGVTGQRRLARNIAGGLDHQLRPFVFAPTQQESKSCGDDQHGFIDNAFPDNVSSSDPPRNCVLGETGNDGPGLFDGLVAGSDDGQPGRLAASRGTTTCPTRSNVTIAGKSINDDVLSCFLRNAATLSDITRETGVSQSMLDPTVVDSPRFVWLPMVYASDRAQKDFQPIIDFVPAFITNETQATPALDDGGNVRNGLVLNGNSVSVLQVMTFNKGALPIDEQAPTVTYDATLAQSVVRLVD